MDYAYSDKLGDEEWASDIDAAIRRGSCSKSDFGPHRCSGCEKPATMVAVGENPASPVGEYAMSPHFRIPHDSHCTVSGQESLIRKGVVTPARTQVPGAASFPAKLVRHDEREVVADDAGASLEREHTRGPHGVVRARGAGPRASEVSTLLPICRHYISYAKIGFAGRQLELPGRSAIEPAQALPYAKAFWYLDDDKYTETMPNRIVYATLMFAIEPEVTDDYIAIPVFAGPKDEKRHRPTVPHRLRIDWSSWSQQRRDATHKRIEQHRADAKRFNHSKKSSGKTDVKANESLLLFAYAQPVLADTTDFVISSADDYCILAVQRGWRPPGKKSPGAKSGGTYRRQRRPFGR